MLEEHQVWRIERYTDETDPFASIHWFVMHGNVVIAQCEVESHAQRILHEHELYVAYARALTRIADMPAGKGIDAAVEAARRALDGGA